MKIKNLNLIFILIIGLVIVPDIVLANVFKDGETTYVLEERKITCFDSEDYYFDGIDENYDLIFSFGREIYDLVKVNKNNECVEMTVQEKLDYLHLEEIYYRLNRDYSVTGDYKIVSYPVYYHPSAKVRTSDKEIVEGKTYYLRRSVLGFQLITEPRIEELNSYYEEVYFEKPKSAKIDKNLTYYIPDSSGLAYDKVENPIEEDILDYYIISDYKGVAYEEVFDLNDDIFKNIIKKDTYVEIEKDESLDKYYILVGEEFEIGEDEYASTYDVYNTDGTKIEELSDIDYLYVYHNSLFGVIKDGVKIYNSNLDLLYENDEMDDFYEEAYNDYTYYMTSWNSDIDKVSYYNMYEYKVIEGNNQTFKNKDLIIKFSGKLDRLEEVLVNDKELNEDAYTVESGSTVVTLDKDYLSKLSDGEYTLKVNYNDGGTASANFVIEELPPQTGDNIYIFFTLSFISVIGLMFTTMYLKKKREN